MSWTVDQERYSIPMPWIGLYITATSVACSIAMLVDYFDAIRRRKFWLPCKLFSLNATSLTVLAIATKLPTDLTTPMPRATEQFAKLSGTALICSSIGHFMQSIGTMEDSQVILNVVPLVIVVITIIVNICIQIGTGVIHAFIPEHVITLCFMLLMLLVTCSSALSFPTMKGLLKQQLELKCQEMQYKRQPDEPAASTLGSLKKDIKKYLLMSLTSNPQHVLSRSCLGVAAGYVCFFQAVVLIEALIRMLKGIAVSVSTDKSSSDYTWSIPLIVFSQAFTVALGALPPCIRVLFVDLRNTSSVGTEESQGHQSPQSVEREEQLVAVKNHRNKLEVERYWIQRFVEWRDRPLMDFDIPNRHHQKLIHGLKNLILEAIRWVHVKVILFSKFIDPGRDIYRPQSSKDIPNLKRKIFQAIDKLRIMLARKILQAIEKEESALASYSTTEPVTEEAQDFAATETELQPFVLRLKDEFRFVGPVMHSCNLKIDRLIQKGRSNPLPNLTNLLKQGFDGSPGFAGSAQYNANNHAQEPYHCWALPLMTLTSIALAIPCIQRGQMKQLLRDGLSECLKYVRHVDKSLDAQGCLVKVREAADAVWQGVHLYNRWLDMNLAAFSTEKKDLKNVIKQLANKGSSYDAELESLMNDGTGDKKSGLRWPPKALALYSMANICKNILDTDNKFNIDDADGLFDRLRVVISDMLRACLAELPRALYLQCHISSMEAKEDRVMDAACLLGEAENILEMIPKEDLGVNRKYVEHWRSLMPNWSDLPRILPSQYV